MHVSDKGVHGTVKIIFLGTNGWYDSETGNSICTLIDTQDHYIILDAGNGIYKADRYIKKDKPVILFLSHFHLDHIEGLHVLAKFKFKKLDIYGQPGTEKVIADFLGDKFSIPPEKLSYPCKLHDIDTGSHSTPVSFKCLELQHASRCFGYRFELEGKTISYCTDTGYCDAAVKLSKDADILISECALAPGITTPGWPHMNPQLAAKLAKESGAKKLVMTHFDAEQYTRSAQRTAAQSAARKVFRNSFAASDNMLITL
jgi:ribonuclease BN (tRNA processing enzyme)